jgi:Rho-binding antiterminator
MSDTGYTPISCEFHDVLEANATLRKPVQIRFRDDAGAVQERLAVVQDVFAREGSEFVALSTGDTVRLDRLLGVDSAKLADF